MGLIPPDTPRCDKGVLVGVIGDKSGVVSEGGERDDTCPDKDATWRLFVFLLWLVPVVGGGGGGKGGDNRYLVFSFAFYPVV